MRICDCSSDVCSSDLELGDIGLYPGVDLQRHGLAAGILHQLRGLMHRCGLVADDELRALGGEAQRARAADAAARARDDRDLAVQCAHHAPPEIVAPPSHTMVCPVVKAPALLARTHAAPAVLCGSPLDRTRVVEGKSVDGLLY